RALYQSLSAVTEHREPFSPILPAATQPFFRECLFSIRHFVKWNLFPDYQSFGFASLRARLSRWRLRKNFRGNSICQSTRFTEHRNVAEFAMIATRLTPAKGLLAKR